MKTNSYTLWEEQLTEAIATQFQCSYGDAAGIVEAHEAIVSNCFSDAVPPEMSAVRLIRLIGGY